MVLLKLEKHHVNSLCLSFIMCKISLINMSLINLCYQLGKSIIILRMLPDTY